MLSFISSEKEEVVNFPIMRYVILHFWPIFSTLLNCPPLASVQKFDTRFVIGLQADSRIKFYNLCPKAKSKVLKDYDEGKVKV